ncbi:MULTISPECIES: hypothetical protein [unclassified Pseudomonas]|uniref:hypothetical protein n=1 Tax=unclassified Pseudomonas TaxID=196821 RepID=UPI000BE43556|nr:MULTISPECIES: hypothetical protein [unclassified Pseudomonas]
MQTYKIETNEGSHYLEADSIDRREDGCAHFLAADGSDIAVYPLRNIAFSVVEAPAAEAE